MLSSAFRKLAEQFIAVNSVSSEGTAAACDFLQPLWEQAGLRVQRQPLPGEPAQLNLLGGPGGGAEGPGGVLLVTHLDTVPPGPRDRWENDPWKLTEDGGCLFGLGVADVKLDALCKLEAARRLQGRRLQRPFWLLGTCGEEVGLRGAKHFAASPLFQEVAPRFVFCGEPSELRLIHAHKGYAVVRCVVRDTKARLVTSAAVEELRFEGKAAHSSTPHLGKNAVLEALRWAKEAGAPVLAARGGSSTNVVPAECVLQVASPREAATPAQVRFLPAAEPLPNHWRALATAAALEELWQELLRAQAPSRDARFDPCDAVGGVNLLGTGAPAAAQPGQLYGVAEVSAWFDARLLPQQSPEALLHAFRAQAAEWVAKLGHGELTLEVHVERNAGGMALPEDAELLRRAGTVLARAELPASPHAKPTSTEAGVFFRRGVETCVFGPGRSTGNAHTPNERIEMAQLEKACDIYESLVLELCGS